MYILNKGDRELNSFLSKKNRDKGILLYTTMGAAFGIEIWRSSVIEF